MTQELDLTAVHDVTMWPTIYHPLPVLEVVMRVSEITSRGRVPQLLVTVHPNGRTRLEWYVTSFDYFVRSSYIARADEPGWYVYDVVETPQTIQGE